MWVVFVLLVAAYTPTHIRRTVRHPMMLAVLIWALLHLLVNGDLASLLLFGGLGAFAVSKVLLIGARQMPELGTRQPMVKDAITIASEPDITGRFGGQTITGRPTSVFFIVSASFFQRLKSEVPWASFNAHTLTWSQNAG